MKQLLIRSSMLAVLLAALFSGCAHRQAVEQPREFQVRGVIEKLEPDGKTAVIQHEEIPGYMSAMTMSLEVKRKEELAGLAPGDVVTFRMLVTEEEGWIEDVRKVGVANPSAPPRESFRRAPIVDPLSVGDVVPDYRFTNQFNQPIALSQFRGQALALVFMYTRCPYPNFCPRMANNFLDVQKKLKALPNAPTNWHLLSITFDPAYDTPARLKEYAAQWRHDPARWTFVTAELWTIDGITEQFGLQFWREEGSVIGHNARAAVLDPKGRVHRIFTGNEWKPDEVVSAVVEAAKRTE